MQTITYKPAQDFSKVSEVELTYKSDVPASERVQIANSQDCERIFRAVMDVNKIEHKEMFYAMYLNRNNKVLGVLLISEGGTCGTVADPKIVFHGALKINATSVAICHNHPSGNKVPSADDNKLTAKIKEAGKLLDIPVIDHIILVPTEGYFSYADNSMM